jgi:protein-S-isoprenylcysteine O-methyltransferase Ste14
MTHSFYPKLLVFFQFGLIAFMLYFSHGVLHSLTAILLFILGTGVGLWAVKLHKRGNFNIQPKLKEGCVLVTDGIYAYIRHPMYASVTLMMFAVLVSTPTPLELLMFLSLIFVLFLKAKREEKLWCAHDEAYLEYKKNSKYFIPYIL